MTGTASISTDPGIIVVEADPAMPRPDPVGPMDTRRCPVVVAATFTADPIAPTLQFWLGQMGMEGAVSIAPYNQVIQELLDPNSAMGGNAEGTNVVLVRVLDWGVAEASRRRGAEDLVSSLRSFSSRNVTPTIVVACPSPSRTGTSIEAIEALEREIADGVASIESALWMDSRDLAPYPVDRVHDPARERQGHIPYTPDFYSAMATAVARRIHLNRTTPAKVIALDCDNTLWRGVVGEDGPAALSLTPGMRAVQEFVVARQAQGMLLALVSKNAEADVLGAFEARPDFHLRPSHLASWRINWQPKSRNLREIAQELNLGLDSIVFLDDNPVECAEVRAACPEVIALQLPDQDEQIAEFLRHVWAFDRRHVTAEDARRTAMYRENADRARFELQAGGLAEFLAGLELRIDIAPPTPGEWARSAQLTQKTNQFNFTTIRRSEAELTRVADQGLDCLRVCVSDRFGDYGLVGLMIFGPSPVSDALRVETFLLSCRALGRGVEHAMLAHLGAEARRRHLRWVEAAFTPTARNRPAAEFLGQITPSQGPGDDSPGTNVYRWPVEAVANLRYGHADRPQGARPSAEPIEGSRARPMSWDRSAFHGRVSGSWRRVAAISEVVEASQKRARPDLGDSFVEPSTETQRRLAGLWARVLGLDRVGLRDEFSALGGTSLQAAHLFAEVEASFGTRLPMTTILDDPDIERLAARIEDASAGAGQQRCSLHVLRPGEEAGPSLFLVHDGDGETLLYLNLARLLPGDLNVYGLRPRRDARSPVLHSRISEMAAHYLAEIRHLRPRGAIHLGGMCAGGVIAFEMAAQLRSQCLPVGLVALFDSAVPGSPLKAGLLAGRRWCRFRETLLGGEDSAGPGLRRAAIKACNLIAYEATSRCRRLIRRARFHLFRSALDRGRSAPYPARGLSVRSVYEMAERDHQPASALDTRVVLFRATEGRGDDEPFASRFVDPDLGWRDHCGPNYLAVDVAGGHASMLQEPHVGGLAERLSTELRASPSGEIGRS